jgi:hypothetical protein
MPPFCRDYQIGLTVATLHPVSWYGIPIPINNHFLQWSVARLCGDASARGYGFPTDKWVHPSMSQDQLYGYLSFFANITDASVQLFIQTYKDTSSLPVEAIFQTQMYRPVDGDGKNLVPRSAMYWTNVLVNFGHMIEQ